MEQGISYCGCSNSGMCDCGAESDGVVDWTWVGDRSTSSALVSDCGTMVNFHPHISTGTAVAVGCKSFVGGLQHFWEVKPTRPVYGTDMMIGFATPNADLQKSGEQNYSSLLGKDEESWGFSHNGYIHHKGKKTDYAQRFIPSFPRGKKKTPSIAWDKGSVIGVHLDTFRGTAEFYINRRPCGVAFWGLKNKILFPVVSSTAVLTGFKLVCARSFQTSLQFLCTRELLVNQRTYVRKPVSGWGIIPPGLQISLQHNYCFFLDCNRKVKKYQHITFEDSFEVNPANEPKATPAAKALKYSRKPRKSSRKMSAGVRDDYTSDEDDEGIFFVTEKLPGHHGSCGLDESSQLPSLNDTDGSGTVCRSQDVFFVHNSPSVTPVINQDRAPGAESEWRQLLGLTDHSWKEKEEDEEKKREDRRLDFGDSGEVAVGNTVITEKRFKLKRNR